MKSYLTWTYVFFLMIWLTFSAIITAFVISMSLNNAESRFTQFSNALFHDISEKTKDNETIIEGFAAVFDTYTSTELKKISQYSKLVIERHPQIYALEIVQVVPKTNLNEFIALQHKTGNINFQIKNFSYNTDRKWRPVQNKAVYYPIIFIAPMKPGFEEVIGMDMETVPYSLDAMAASQKKHISVATFPFRLIEGNLAYVIFHPVPSNSINKTQQNNAHSDAPYIVSLVVDVEKMLKSDTFNWPTEMHVQVYHNHFSPNDPIGELLNVKATRHTQLEELLLPHFTYQRTVTAAGQPIALHIEKQTRWSDLNQKLLLIITLATLLSLTVLVSYIRSHQRDKLAKIASEGHLWFLANHDPLTGLPNRNLLRDRMEVAIARAQRQSTKCGIMFLDLNGFKLINDSYGHKTGDQLLKNVADRISICIRADDTVARLSGDEFVVLIENIESRKMLEMVAEKIRQSISRQFIIENQPISAGISVGIALYPEEGINLDELLKLADSRMYSDKHAAEKIDNYQI
ncbi:sensor domain-containing diguanylate cyclase [Sulfurirhabdus autotrophica]|nr:sensor domain-containing diguanylate cyclase [Sulfurirhabdus autotrophica]